jgi:hypothetical protein
MILAFNPTTKEVGGMITGRNFGCIFNVGIASPAARTTPDYYWLANRAKLYHFGDSASLDELYWAHGDAGQLLNPENINSPLNEDNMRGLLNPRNQSYNPNPAFAAYRVNPSIANVIAKKQALNNTEGSSTPGTSAHAPLTGTLSAEQAASQKQQQQATAQLAASFSLGSIPKKRPSTSGNELMENRPPPAPRPVERRRGWSPQQIRRPLGPKPGGGGSGSRG